MRATILIAVVILVVILLVWYFTRKKKCECTQDEVDSGNCTCPKEQNSNGEESNDIGLGTDNGSVRTSLGVLNATMYGNSEALARS